METNALLGVDDNGPVKLSRFTRSVRLSLIFCAAKSTRSLKETESADAVTASPPEVGSRPKSNPTVLLTVGTHVVPVDRFDPVLILLDGLGRAAQVTADGLRRAPG